MIVLKKPFWQGSHRRRIAGAAAALFLLGAAGGAGAMAMTRESVEMAPAVPTTITRLPQARGVVTIKGTVAETYGTHFVIQDKSGRALVDVAPENAPVSRGSGIIVQGLYDDGQLHASYLVDPKGNVDAVGGPPPPPPPPPPSHGPRHNRSDSPDLDGPPPPPPPPPPPGENPPRPARADGATLPPAIIDRQPVPPNVEASPASINGPAVPKL